MRRMVQLDSDTAGAVEALQRETGCSMSEAVNELIRRGMLTLRDRRPFVPRTRRLGIGIDVSNVADALDRIEPADPR
jgi:hypothetical protein